ncbi:hypothetical protein KSE_51710 [Kitasatospora setae KM-6054]|uniref:Uncharacterized protein n=1 Tax=Kitasatospora setae (strain ATCC 33774 / DSM 43861 / JCM 3304 / KCC A-0304 / NBRC 14216 / KM-6054) TaxID=452652 RepID=E4NHH0_KITSK|nr:hypothetical protein KSE_51710 [Kitasatospora setae KM-6054]
MEFAVATEHYLAGAPLADGSRRVYRIALRTWAWLLVGRTPPTGPERRRAVPPVLPLALLDGPGAPERVAAAFAARAGAVGPRTANRELSALRAALRWWHARGWLAADPAAGLHPLPTAPADPAGALDADRLRAVLALRVPLREKVLWHLVRESGAPIERLLALDVDRLDPAGRQARTAPDERPLRWRGGTARLLPLLVAGRTAGPLFLTGRRAPAGTPERDRCPLTGRGRLSYRRAAELFTAATAPLDPAGRGWTLHALAEPRH